MGFGKDGRGQIHWGKLSLTLGTLAANSSLKSGGGVVVTDHFRLIKTTGVAMYGIGSEIFDEAVVLGIADNDLSTTEIEECMESTQLDPSDLNQGEESLRPVWLLGIMRPGQALAWEETIRWTFHEDVGYTYFVYNLTTGALTTGGVVDILFKNYGVWVK